MGLVTEHAEITDQRLLRGARTRQSVARHAVDVASLEGLGGLSLGRLAADLGLSKSGVQALFVTKENLQVAAAEAAREAFAGAVVEPALASPRGAARLRALVEGWLSYVETPLFPGGCFWAANLPEFDSRPGPVREALVRHQREWRGLLAGELREAVKAGEAGELDPDLVAFQLDAVLWATNIALRVGEKEATARARRILDGFLTP
ncbi:TetR/AcrR family transcriptional regulator, partial [Amycolatopsis rhizosphaerae]